MGDVIVLAERRRMREQNGRDGPPAGAGGGGGARSATFLFDLASPLTYLAAERDGPLEAAGRRLLAAGADRLPAVRVGRTLICGEDRLAEASAWVRHHGPDGRRVTALQPS